MVSIHSCSHALHVIDQRTSSPASSSLTPRIKAGSAILDAVRRWIPPGLIVLALAAVAGAWLLERYVADPSAGELRDAIEAAAPGACDEPVEVRGVDDIGGPGLPAGMVAAKELLCGDTRLAVHFKFAEHDDAVAWAGRGTINGSTYLEDVNLSDADWRRVLARLNLTPG